MDHKKQLALLITNYLKKEMKSGRFNDEALVRLEIATQCIESAYKITPSKHRDDISSIQLDCMLKEYKKILRSEVKIILLTITEQKLKCLYRLNITKKLSWCLY